jgi:hypothetical protein
MIHPGEPQRLVTLHAPTTDERVDERVLERMTDV